jgi:tight adherence protein B
MAYLVAAATFGIVIGIIFGSYWFVAIRPEREASSALKRRLRGERAMPAVRAALLKEARRFSNMPAFNKLLQGRAGLVKPLEQLVQQSGLRVTPGVVLLASACLGLLAFIVVDRVVQYQLAGLIAGVLAALVPVLVVRQARARRVGKFEALFPEAIGLISRAMRAGHGFTTGLAMVAEELPEPVGSEFRLLYDQQNYGLPLNEALRNFSWRVPLLDARFFVTAVLTQREAGGNLSEVLDNLSSVIRDRFQVKREVAVKSAHGRITALVLGLMPPAVAGLMLLINPKQMAMLVTDPLGVRMLVVAVVLQVIGTVAIRQIIKSDY